MAPLTDTRYARSGDLYIAYRAAGRGPVDVLVSGGYMTHVEQNFEWPPYSAFIDALSSFARVIVFDRRGSGLSDRMRRDGNVDEMIDDISSVLDAAGSERATLVGFHDGGPLCSVFAAAHPERCNGLVLFNAYARGRRCEGYDGALTDAEHESVLTLYRERFGRRPIAARALSPALGDDPAWRQWVLRGQRYGASPGAALEWYRLMMELDIRDVLPAIRVPTLVMSRGDRAPRFGHAARHLAAHIPDARLVQLPGLDTSGVCEAWEPVLAEIEQFITGERKTLEAGRVLATVLFTDIVGSTELVQREGDRRWRQRLEGHNLIVRRLLAEQGGHEINTTGDGFLATFDRPGAAIRCATAIKDTLSANGIGVRAALHAGEIERLGEDIGGIAVHIASRILSAAGPGEILVSRTVRDLVAGSDVVLHDAGEHDLKDLREPWRLYAVG